MPSSLDNPRLFLEGLFQHAIDLADPMKVLADYLPRDLDRRPIVLGAGKASARMAEAVEAYYGPCRGLVIVPPRYNRPLKGIRQREASHPFPAEPGALATKEILKISDELNDDDFVITLISGGGSALLTAPCSGLSLFRKNEMTKALLASGASISEINILRKHLSEVKGGQLSARIYPAQVLSLLISDVPKDDISMIASGPTVGGDEDKQYALGIRERYLPQFSDLDAFITSSSVPAAGDIRLSRTENRVVIAPSRSFMAVTERAKKEGLNIHYLGDDVEGEAREVAWKHAKIAKSQKKPCLILSGGELTVTHKGQGIGGPNAEYALALAIALDQAPNIFALAGDTDGRDGSADIAGAYIDPTTLCRGGKERAELALMQNDAHSFFGFLGDQIITGPTFTNINDFRAILCL